MNQGVYICASVIIIIIFEIQLQTQTSDILSIIRYTKEMIYLIFLDISS